MPRAAERTVPPQAAPARTRLRVGFLLAPNFTLSAFANFVDVLRLAADEADRSRPILCDWAVLSDDPAPVRSSCGVRVSPDRRLRDAGALDYLVVVGGVMGDGAVLGQAARAFMSHRAAEGTPLVGLCTGVFTLYEAGLLDGYRCCVSWFHHQDFVDRFAGAAPVSDRIFVVDRDRLTCSGGHGAAHLAAFLVDRHVGASAALKSLNILMIDAALQGERAQPSPVPGILPRDELVKRAVLRMRQSPAEPLRIGALARALGVGRRTLERRMRADLGLAPARVHLEIRLDRAAHMLRMTRDSIAQVAEATGFCDGAHLARAMRGARGTTPAALRDPEGWEAECRQNGTVMLPDTEN